MSPIKVIGQVHFPPDDDTTIVYRTTNNGDSYTPVNQWGTHYGIGYPGEVRRWWGDIPQQKLYGPLIGKDIDETLVQYNWVKKFHPQLPEPDLSIGYSRWLPSFKLQFSEYRAAYYYPSNYLFFRENPFIASIVERDHKEDVATTKLEFDRSWIHYTEDDWNTWTTIWESGPFERVDATFLDEKKHSMWTVTKFRSDTAASGYIPDRYKSYLYKYSIKLSVETNHNASKDVLKIYPTPTKDNIRVLLPRAGRIISLELCSAEGKVFFHTTNVFSISQDLLEWSVPEYLASGLYFLKIRTDDSIYLTKLILQR